MSDLYFGTVRNILVYKLIESELGNVGHTNLQQHSYSVHKNLTHRSVKENLS